MPADAPAWTIARGRPATLSQTGPQAPATNCAAAEHGQPGRRLSRQTSCDDRRSAAPRRRPTARRPA
eukprot:8806076-Alexandrium_andersonii.AAC.1